MTSRPRRTVESGTRRRRRANSAGSTRKAARCARSLSAPGSAPHGVITGPDGAAWVTDGGLNAIVRVDDQRPGDGLSARRAERQPEYARPSTVTASCGSPGRTASTAASIRQPVRRRSFPAPRVAGPYGIATTPDGEVYFGSLAGSYLGAIDRATGEVEVIDTPDAGRRRAPSLARFRRTPVGDRVVRGIAGHVRPRR